VASASYEAIATDQIKAVKSDGRTLIVVASLHQYVAGLSKPKIRPMPKREPQRKRRKEPEAALTA
jgi:hypothetical protein